MSTPITSPYKSVIQVNTFTPAQSAHYFRISRMYGHPCGPLGKYAIASMKRLYKAAGKNWFGAAPELTCEPPSDLTIRVMPRTLMLPGFMTRKQAS